MIDDEYTDPATIFQQYRFGFATLADVPVDRITTGSGTTGPTGGGPGGGNYDPPPCFIGETPIWMADWSEKPIEKIEEDDYVIAFDDYGHLHRARVLRVYKHRVFECLEVDFADDRRTGVTEEHPYWQRGSEFIPIGEIKFSVTYADGDWTDTPIAAKRTLHFENGIYVYNLEIETYQTYIANRDGVHNRKREDI